MPKFIFLRKIILVLSLVIYSSSWAFCQHKSPDSLTIAAFYQQALTTEHSYELLRQLTKEVGHRLSGSKSAEEAVVWAQTTMRKLGFDSVWLQPVMVPHWVRGRAEKVVAFTSKDAEPYPLQALALGNSIGGQVSASVVEVPDYRTLDSLGVEGIRGKIVFYNYPMKREYLSTGEAYGDAGTYRVNGPARAARLGAVATLVRSLTTRLDDIPHTGVTRYTPGEPTIPAVAISTLDAEWLHRTLKNNPQLTVSVATYSQMLDSVKSYNVIGELRGREKPDEYLLAGGHLDSWDVGEGAHDDGTGCVQAIEALHLLTSRGYRPRHTIRAVLFMNEENGLAGGLEYARQAARRNERHVAALESDSGGFTPRGFSMSGPQDHLEQLTDWASLFLPYNLHQFEAGGGGADIGPLRASGTTLIGFRPDGQRYFDLHHTREDTLDKVNPRELALGAASIASLLYLLDQTNW